MKRRKFLAAFGGAAAWPLVARAQQSDRMRRIGVLMGYGESDPEAQIWISAFKQGLRDLAWEDGRNVRIDYRWPADDINRTRGFAVELVALAPDVIMASTNPAVMAAKQATRTIPIVFVIVPDPVGMGFVASFARPDGNLTGFTNFVFTMGDKWLEVLKDLASRTDRVAAVYDPQNPTWDKYFNMVEAAAPSFGVQITAAGGHNVAEIEQAIDTFARVPNGGMIVFPSPLTAVHRERIIALAAKYSLPAVYPARYFTVSGAFISYGVNYPVQYQQAAGYVDRILKGAPPAELPVQAPTKFELAINLKTAKALGLTVPSTLLAQADEVIE